MCYLGNGSTICVPVMNYVEQWSSWAADSHLLHQETPCLVTEKADLVLSLHKSVTCHTSVLFLWKGMKAYVGSGVITALIFNLVLGGVSGQSYP